MGGAPSDSRFITGGVPAEMREGVELTPGVEVAKPTSETVTDIDGAQTQLTRIRLPRPDHIPAGAPKFDPMPEAIARSSNELRYDFPLLPGVQCRVQLIGEPTADHLEQLTEYLTVACKKLREQEARAGSRKTDRHRVNVDDEPPPTQRKKAKTREAPASGEA